MFAVRLPKKDRLSMLQMQINVEGVHVWPFDISFPVDVRFFASTQRTNIRMNRHDYFEVNYLCAGKAHLQIQDRTLLFREGELAVVGSTLYHTIVQRSAAPLTLAVLLFQPDLIRAESDPDGTAYLTPFLIQDSQFPHIVPARTGIPSQVFKLMQCIRAELPAGSTRARLCVKTYLKMILVLLVNQYWSYAGTERTFERQQRALERLRPLFDYLQEHYGDPISVKEAARICEMSESHFMNFFKRATGRGLTAYVNQCRTEHAQALLTATDKSIAEISQKTGFCDQSYFGTIFRRLVGVTPHAYRRQFRGVADGAWKDHGSH